MLKLFGGISFLLLLAWSCPSTRGYGGGRGRQPWNPSWQPTRFSPPTPWRNNSTVTNPIVRIGDGSLRGFTMSTISSRPISAFLGIPFAQPPVGRLRFRDPVKNLPWVGTRDAIAESPLCIQNDLEQFGLVHGQEDCLYLNVYVPQAHLQSSRSTRKRLPVMVWIHGGGFFFGAGAIYGPRYLLDEDVVFVTLNYRLGPFGFFSTGDSASYGNQGLKDQTLALKWVQENIASFGGDPNSVTIFGQSAGGIAVHMQMASPLSKGLFHRAISHSGTGLTYAGYTQNPREIAFRVGDNFNCTGTTHSVVECLRSVNETQLAAVQNIFYEWNLFPIVVFGVVLEPSHPGAFLTETVEQAYQNNRVAKIPWITGLVNEEMAWLVSGLIQDPNAVADINNDWDRVGPIFLGLNSDESLFVRQENATEIANRMWDYYMGGQELSWETRHQFAELFGNRYLAKSSIESMRLHSRYTGEPVYAYHFTYDGKYSVVQSFGASPDDYGVAHLDDLLYLMNNTEYYSDIQPEDEELQMSRVYTGTWANFATYGKPFVDGPDGSLQDIWEPIPFQSRIDSVEPLPFLEMNLRPRMVSDPFAKHYRFWQSLGELGLKG